MKHKSAEQQDSVEFLGVPMQQVYSEANHLPI